MSTPPTPPTPPTPTSPHESAFRTQLIALIDDALMGNPKAALVAARFLPGEIEWLQRKAVMRARADGYDWGVISRLLAITRQGARQKYGPWRAPTASPYSVAMRRYRRPFEEGEELIRRLASGTPFRAPEPDDPIFW